MTDRSTAADRAPDAPAGTAPSGAGRTAHVITFGCQMNRVDTEIALNSLREAGWRIIDDEDAADAVLFNTCSVRQHAEDRVWSRLGVLKRRKRRDPDFQVGVMGCMAQRDGEEVLERAPHVDAVIGTQHFHRTAEILAEARSAGDSRLALDQDFKEDVYDRDIAQRPLRHQAYVSVMQGCDVCCTFCIVPFTRGRERSRAIPLVVEEVERLVDDGVVEVNLLGQTVDAYGKGLAEAGWGRADGTDPDLADLLEAVHEVEGLRRLRFITSHPSWFTERIARAVGELPKVCEYLHLPPQHGNDDVLGRMRRRYDRAGFLQAVERARRHAPDVALAADWIVGFPGETDAEFEDAVSLMREVDFDSSFVFKYSPRPGTVAARRFEDDVPVEVKKERNQVLLAEQEAISARRHRALHGTVQEVLLDGPSKTDPDKWTGRTRRHTLVHVTLPAGDAPGDAPRAGRNPAGRVVDVRITDSTPLYLFAELPGDDAGTPATAGAADAGSA